ncbi:hypothetical protein F5148DRAFT_1276064 [Russula earlei]|uniref:Uncharacterized protein n=1 Tax=Russula earlei TaxID=71964 RepID=A0ACC0U9M2_9AGAM|nr:hypothetical protein F5148DRAFT_1276064 [Russula earlei]
MTLTCRDVLGLLEQQLASTEFEGQFEYTPFQEFDFNGDRDTIAEDPQTYGAMLVPIFSGSDKTTVPVATGNQEYHPVYASAGNISNTARRGHGNAVMPIAFLPIPKTSKCQWNKPEFQKFCRQLYHLCLEAVFEPLRLYMTKPKVVRCPDGHFHCAIFSLGPYIADYPEQVWLVCIVLNWCPKCDARPENLDNPGSHCRSHAKTDFLINQWDPGILWDQFGIRSDIVPFTYSFPWADIHELLAPDLFHQLIKGTFKDHLVEWVVEYLHITHGEKGALEIIEDIDHWYTYGQDYNQWTGDDSKALIKVFLAAIAGYVPSAMVHCIANFMDACYIAHRNAITSPSLEHFHHCVNIFQELRNIFITMHVWTTISLPRQHALDHFYHAMQFFGSPNGLCSLITESKHIKAMTALYQLFSKQGMMLSTTSSYMGGIIRAESSSAQTCGDSAKEEEDDDGEPGYPRDLQMLAVHIKEPSFPLAFHQFLYTLEHPDLDPPSAADVCPPFKGKINVHHSAVAVFYAPSDLCGAGGMKRDGNWTVSSYSSPFTTVERTIPVH